MTTQAPDIFWTKSLNDWQLLERHRARGGSQPAFAELVARHVGLVYGICRRSLADADLAEQASREVFVKLARCGPARRRAGGILSGWLVETTHDVCDGGRGFALRCEAAFDATLDSLRRADLDLLLARYYHGWNLRQLSDAFGISQNAAARRVSRALSRLRQKLASRGVVTTDDQLVCRLATLDHEPVHRNVVAGIRAALRESHPIAPAPQPSVLNRVMAIITGWASSRATA